MFADPTRRLCGMQTRDTSPCANYFISDISAKSPSKFRRFNYLNVAACGCRSAAKFHYYAAVFWIKFSDRAMYSGTHASREDGINLPKVMECYVLIYNTLNWVRKKLLAQIDRGGWEVRQILYSRYKPLKQNQFIQSLLAFVFVPFFLEDPFSICSHLIRAGCVYWIRLFRFALAFNLFSSNIILSAQGRWEPHSYWRRTHLGHEGRMKQ